MMLWHFETQLECNNNDVVHARHPSQLHIIDEDLSLCSSGLRLPYKNYEFHLQEFLNARKVSVSMPCPTVQHECHLLSPFRSSPLLTFVVKTAKAQE